MSKCVNCGGELRFDIRSQMLICASCGATEDPKELDQYGRFAEEREMEFTLFECPQCGGSVYSTDNSINGFCSYCGSNVVLRNRMEKMVYPRSIAPFKITKEACKTRYQEYVKKALFVPPELKQAEYLDNFRGIYMPYWGYDVKISGYLSLNGLRTFRESKRVYTRGYKCTGWLDAKYQGIFYDASAAFDDHFSWQIAPFDAHSLVDFSPAYLSGFYADMLDVGYRVYEDNALQIAKDKVFESAQLHKAFPSTTFSDDQLELFRPSMDVELNAVYSSLFPVWFLSHRTDNRVSYAVVNGQTGRVAADLPVDRKKFLITSVLMAIPLFVLLCFTILMKPVPLLIASETLAAFAIMLLMNMVKKIAIRDYRLDDKGYLSKNNRGAYLERSRYEVDAKERADMIKSIVAVAAFFVVLAVWLLNALQPIFRTDNKMVESFLIGMLTLLLEVMAIRCTTYIKEGGRANTGRMVAGVWIVFIAALAGFISAVFYPDRQILCFIAIVLMMAGTLMSQLVALDQYNIMTSLPLPQLDRKGGEA